MGQHRALYQIGGISPGQKNDFTTARPLAKARDFRSGVVMNGHDALEMPCPLFLRKQTWIGARMEAEFR
jgi:hypothetical protein